MADVETIDSNVTGLRYAEEASFKTLGGSPVWYGLEVNSYNNFGGSIVRKARTPITADRQERKGVVVDVDAAGGFNVDLTQDNLQNILQGFFFADLRTKDELAVATVDGTGNDYEPAAGGDGYVAGDLLFAKGFDDDANNGLKVVTGVPGAATVPVTDTGLVTGATQSGVISRVGFEFGDAELTVVVAGTLPALHRNAGTKDLTDFGLIPGEWIFVGGDAAGNQYAGTENNGWKRVRSVTATDIFLDKSVTTMTVDAGTGKTIRLFFGRVLRNEVGAAIQKRTYNLERTLGAPDDAQPNDIQSEYLVGAVPNQLTINLTTAEIVKADMTFVAGDHETRDAATGVKSGDRPALIEDDAFNTTSHFRRLNMAVVSNTDEAVVPLFALLTEMTLNINNNVTPTKAISRMGAFSTSAGNFTVGGTCQAYFTTVAGVSAVRDNDDVTLDGCIYQNNAGMVFDIPLMGLGDARLSIEKDQPIRLPLEMSAAKATKAISAYDYTLLMTFFDYLPTLAASS